MCRSPKCYVCLDIHNILYLVIFASFKSQLMLFFAVESFTRIFKTSVLDQRTLTLLVFLLVICLVDQLSLMAVCLEIELNWIVMWFVFMDFQPIVWIGSIFLFLAPPSSDKHHLLHLYDETSRVWWKVRWRNDEEKWTLLQETPVNLQPQVETFSVYYKWL